MKKNQKSSKENPVFTIGELNIILKIDFRDEDLKIKEKDKKEKNINVNYYKLEDLTELKCLSFLDNNKEVLNRFQLKSNNEILKMLLIGSQNMDKQTLIDYVCINIPQFNGEEKFFNNVLDFLTKKHGIILNKTPLSKSDNYSIRIKMSHKGQKKEIHLGSDGEDKHEDDNDIMKEGETKIKDKNNNDDEEEDCEDYEENEAMKKKLIPKFKRKNVLCNLYPQYNKYGMIYLNFEDLNKIPGKFNFNDLFELLEFFKKKNSVIFINYYQQEKPEEEENDNKNKKGKNKNKKKK